MVRIRLGLGYCSAMVKIKRIFCNYSEFRVMVSVLFLFFISTQPPPGLPDRNYVKLSKSDARLIEKWIDNKLGPTAVRGQKDNLTTNRSEATHLTVLRGSPKCRNRRRNFSGRAKSAVHSMSVGVIDSVVTANTILGAENATNCPANHARRQLRNRNIYHKNRRTSLAYRASKFASVRRARHRRQSSSRGYRTGVQDPIVRLDHSYTPT